MPYSYITLAQAEDLLAAILTDDFKVRFISDELRTNIIEALRTFSGLTGMWEVESDPIAVAVGTIFVDIPTSFASLRGYTLRDRDLIGSIQYHFLEPKSVAAWTGSERFKLDDFTKAIQRRRDQFLLETGIRLNRSIVPTSPAVIAADTESIDLDQSIIDIRRAAWVTLDGKVTPLWPDSPFGMRAASPTWNLDSDLPRAYLLSERAPLQMMFGPPPSNAGQLDLLTVNSGATLDPTVAPGVLLGIPDDFAWVIKWGAMADLLGKDGPARDYARSLFCERRYRLGVAAALSYRSINEARMNSRVLQIDSIESLDMARPYWQSKTGVTMVVATAGHNIIALEQPPRSASQLQLTLCRNVPVPVNAGDFLQIGKEYLDIILGYASHLSMFKIGGTQLAATTQAAESFFLAAADYNERLKEFSAWEDVAYSEAKLARMRDRGIRRVTGATVSEAT